MNTRQFIYRALPNLVNPPLLSGPRGDMMGAVVGTLASIPQTMAYGLMVGAALGNGWGGVGVMAGLFGSALAALASAVAGGCPVIIPGPRAATIIVLVALYGQLLALPELATLPNAPVIVMMLGGVAIAVAGLLQMTFGLLRLGRLTGYIPVPVVAGFINGSAILILMSQIWSATGVPMQKSLGQLGNHLGEIRPLTIVLSLGTALIILNAGRWSKRIPAALIGLILGTVVYHLADLGGLGAAFGGTMAPIADGVAFGFIGIDAATFLTKPAGEHLLAPLMIAAATIAILSSLDTLLSVAACDSITMRRSDGSRQLVAEGAANVLAGIIGMLPSSGSMARTTAALRAHMTTALGPMLVTVLTICGALMLAQVIHYLPKAVMAGLLIAVAIELFDKWSVAMIRRLLRAPDKRIAARGDILSLTLVVITTVAINLATAVVVGIVISLLSFAMQMASSPVRRSYRATALAPRIHGDAKRLEFIQRHGSRIAVIEMEGALFYGTAASLEAAVEALVADGVVHVVCDIRRVKDIDVSGARVLERIQANLTRSGGMLAISYVERERRGGKGKRPGSGDGDGITSTTDRRRSPTHARKIWRKLEFLGSISSLGERNLVPDTHHALRLCEKHVAARIVEEGNEPDTMSRNTAILRGIDRHGMRCLRTFMTQHHYQTGEAIFGQGDPPDSVYFIANGVADVIINLPGTERKMRLQTLTSGAVFGEMAIIAPSARSASVVATEPTRCYRLAADAFEQLKQQHPSLAFSLISNMADIFAQRLRASNMMLADLEA